MVASQAPEGHILLSHAKGTNGAAWPLGSRWAGSNSPWGNTVTHPGAVAVAVNCFVTAAIWAGAASKQASKH